MRPITHPVRYRIALAVAGLAHGIRVCGDTVADGVRRVADALITGVDE